jgi:hypothetical protein
LTAISIKINRKGRHWVFEIDVDRSVQPTRVFGCSDGMLPLLASLISAEAQNTGVGTLTNSHSPTSPASISVTMPSGRLLTFNLATVENSLADSPQFPPGVWSSGGAGQPVDRGD